MEITLKKRILKLNWGEFHSRRSLKLAEQKCVVRKNRTPKENIRRGSPMICFNLPLKFY